LKTIANPMQVRGQHARGEIWSQKGKVTDDARPSPLAPPKNKQGKVDRGRAERVD